MVETPTGPQIVTNATGAARGLIYISSGYRPIQPICAIRLDARGDLTLNQTIDRSLGLRRSERYKRRALYTHADRIRRLSLSMSQQRHINLLPSGYRRIGLQETTADEREPQLRRIPHRGRWQSFLNR